MYYDNNVSGTLTLLKAMVKHDIKVCGSACCRITPKLMCPPQYFIFSSTAAVFGMPKNIPIVEGEATEPINPYGQTKLAVEQMLPWCVL